MRGGWKLAHMVCLLLRLLRLLHLQGLMRSLLCGVILVVCPITRIWRLAGPKKVLLACG